MYININKNIKLNNPSRKLTANKLSKVIGYKSNTQKLVVFLHISNEKSGKKFENNPIHNNMKNNNILRNNFNQ